MKIRMTQVDQFRKSHYCFHLIKVFVQRNKNYK